MEIQQIFATVHTIKYPGESVNEFRRLISNWKDPEYLESFFEENKSDLANRLYNDISVEDAIFDTIDEARELQLKIMQLAKENNQEVLEKLFKPLHIGLDKDENFSERKAYGVNRKSWLRFYAIRTIDGAYLITGGAIKLTKRMQSNANTAKELEKLKRCKEFLKEEMIYSQEGFLEMEL